MALYFVVWKAPNHIFRLSFIYLLFIEFKKNHLRNVWIFHLPTVFHYAIIFLSNLSQYFVNNHANWMPQM